MVVVGGADMAELLKARYREAPVPAPKAATMRIPHTTFRCTRRGGGLRPSAAGRGRSMGTPTATSSWKSDVSGPLRPCDRPGAIFLAPATTQPWDSPMLAASLMRDDMWGGYCSK